MRYYGEITDKISFQLITQYSFGFAWKYLTW